MRLTNATAQLTFQAFDSYAINLKKMNMDLKTLFEERNKVEINQQLNRIISLSTLAIFTHIQITDSMDSILNTQSTHKFLELIDIDLLNGAIEEIRASLFPNTFLAGQHASNLIQILENSSKHVLITDGILHIFVRIPITIRTEKLLKLYKIPIKRGKEYFIIKSLMPYVSKLDNSYLGFFEYEISTLQLVKMIF